MNDQSIQTLTKQIRELVNENLGRLEIEIPSTRWDQLCASMDLISDTTDAIEFYEQFDENDKCFEYYLFHYGLLQALFVQQDAVEHLFEALIVPCEANKVLSAIREIRNDVVGHPSQRQKKREPRWRGGKCEENPWLSKIKEKQYSNFLVQITLNKKSFSYHTHNASIDKFSEIDFIRLQTYSGGSFHNEVEVDVLDMIKSQREIFERELKTLLDSVRKEIKNKMSEFQNKPLRKMMSISGDMSYLAGKICDFSAQPQDIKLNLSFLNKTREDILNIQAELEQRNDYNENWNHSIKTLLFTLDWIERILNQKSEDRETPCFVLSFSLRHFLSEFYEMLGSVDEKYQNLDTSE